MVRRLLLLLMVLSFAGPSAIAQVCADVNGDSHVNVSDMVYMLNEHLGGPAIPAGKGDIDYRQGYTAGDLRYLVDYIFNGGNVPGCPPFSPYTLTMGNDTIFLPSYEVPAGSGQFVLPIYLLSHTRVGDLVLPFQVTGAVTGVYLDSLKRSPAVAVNVSASGVNGLTGVIAMSGFDYNQILGAGVNLLGEAYFHYAGSPGGVIALDTVTLRPHTFLNYIYSSSPDNFNVQTIGIPRIVIASGVPFPTLSLQPDTLFFQTLTGYPNPDAQQMLVVSSGDPFAWTLTKPSWVNVSATTGISGQTIDVTPNIAGMAAGTYFADIVVSSSGAVGSPKKVVVKLTLKAQYPSLDANCDGAFDISDVVAIIQYIFESGNLCNPCTGAWEPLTK